MPSLLQFLMQVLIIVFGTISVAKVAYAAETTQPLLRTHQELMALSASDRAIYLVGLQALTFEIEFMQRQATKNEPAKAGAALGPRLQMMLQALAPLATAQSEYFCFSNGFVKIRASLEMGCNFSARCQTSPSQSGSTLAECNPILFGANVCAPQGRPERCEPKQSIEEIARSIDSGQWDRFRSSFNTICTPAQIQAISDVRGIRRQAQNECQVVQNRITEIERAMQNPGAAPTGAAQVTQASRRQISTVTRRSRETLAARSTESGEAPANAGISRICNIRGLIVQENLTPGASDGLFSPLTLEQTQALMCERGPIDESVIAARRRVFAARKAALQASRYKGYFLPWITNMERNFESCVAAARNGRNTGAPREATGRARITFQNSSVRIAGTDRSGHAFDVATQSEYIGNTLSAYNLTACDVTISGGASARPADAAGTVR